MNITLLAIATGQKICWASNPSPAAIQDVSINHRGAYVVVPEQLLHGSNIIAIFE
jgi:hypothetical protein